MVRVARLKFLLASVTVMIWRVSIVISITSIMVLRRENIKEIGRKQPITYRDYESFRLLAF